MTKPQLKVRQNDLNALKLILLQRTLNNRAKAWGLLRFVGIVALGVFIPVITFYNEKASVPITAVAILWMFLARVWFVRMEQLNKNKGALVQNEYDSYVFGIDNPTKYSESLRLEDRADLLPDDNKVKPEAKRYHLTDWYPFINNIDDSVNVAIAQRTNGAYSARLLRSTSNITLAMAIAWIGFVVAYAMATDLNSFDLIAGIIIPILPGALDIAEYWFKVRDAHKQRLRMADEIEDQIKNGDDLQQHHTHWQQLTYELRRDSPYVPNVIYKGTRERNERAMKIASNELANWYNHAQR